MPSAALCPGTGEDATWVPSRQFTTTRALLQRIGYGLSTARGFLSTASGLDRPTGDDTQRNLAALVRNWFSLLDIAEDSTGYGWFRAPLLRAYAGEFQAPQLDETGTSADQAPKVLAEAVSIADVATAASVRTPEGDAAARLRELTGLQIGKLAEIFGVSRPTFYNWLKGTRPRGEHRDRLLFVLQVMEEAGRILGEQRWGGGLFIAPSATSARVPLELLKAGQYDLCRSLLTRSGTARKALPVRTKRHLSGQDLRDAMQRHSPRAAIEDIDEVGPSGEGPEGR